MTIFRKWIVLAVILFATSTLSASENAGYGGWNSCSIGGGGYVQNVVQAVDNPEVLYTYIDVGGLYRSDDGGKNWRMLHGALPTSDGVYQVRGLCVDQRDNNSFIIAVGSHWAKWPGAIFRTTDAGKTFTQILEASFGGNAPERADGIVFARDPQNPDCILAASYGDGVYKSLDNGMSWTNVGMTGYNITDLRFDLFRQGQLWLCAKSGKFRVNGKEAELKGGFWKATSYGEKWELLSEDGPTEIVQCAARTDELFGLRNERPAISRDQGKSWQSYDAALPQLQNQKHTSPGRFRAINAGPNFLLLADSAGNIYRCGEDWQNWQEISKESIETIHDGRPWFKPAEDFGKATASIIIDRTNPTHWFITDWYAIYQTSDSGKKWSLTIDGIEDTVIHCFAADPTNPELVFLGMADNGFFRSEDGGKTFSQRNYKNGGITNNVKTIAVAPSQPTRVYATSTQSWHWEANQVFVSDDSGMNWWRAKMRGLPDMKKHSCNTVVVDSKNKDLIFIGVSGEVKPGDGGVYRSEDAGDNWVWDSAGMEGNKNFFQSQIWHSGAEIARDSAEGMICLSTTKRIVYRRSKDDRKWVKVALSDSQKPTCVVSDPNKPGSFYLARAEEGLLFSSDCGENWQSILDKNVFHIALNPTREGELLAGCSENVWYSADSGKSWRILDPELPQKINSYVAFSGRRAFAGSDGSGAFWINLK